MISSLLGFFFCLWVVVFWFGGFLVGFFYIQNYKVACQACSQSGKGLPFFRITSGFIKHCKPICHADQEPCAFLSELPCGVLNTEAGRFGIFHLCWSWVILSMNWLCLQTVKKSQSSLPVYHFRSDPSKDSSKIMSWSAVLLSSWLFISVLIHNKGIITFRF